MSDYAERQREFNRVAGTKHRYPGGQFIPICELCGCDAILASNGVPTCEAFRDIGSERDARFMRSPSE